ncbi:MAG: YetF domain-containing protein [Bacillota bacterium]
MENGVFSVFGSVEKLSSAGYLLRVIGVAVLLYLASRFLPRRSGGQFSSYDFAFFWMMGGLVAAPLFDSKISFAYVLVSVTTIYAWHYLISYIMVKNRTMARIIGGTAIPLVLGGKVIKKNMRKALFPLEMLFSQLRQMDASNITEVEAAILETNGSVSVLKKSDFQPITPKDLQIFTQDTALPPVVLINDGRIIEENLRKINLDESWLRDQLEKVGIFKPESIYLAGLDGSGQFFYSTVTIV